MRLIINGQPEDFPVQTLTVADLITSRRPRDAGACAVEINRELAPRRDWPSRRLHDGDHVEIVTLVGGG